MRIPPMRRSPVFLLLPILVGLARAQPIPPFSQNFTHPTGAFTTSTLHFNHAPYDSAITFQPLLPPDNDLGVGPITTSLHFSGQTLEWAMSLDLDGILFRQHNYSPTNVCGAVFRLYGVGPEDTAIVTVRVASAVAFTRTGSPGLGISRGRVSLATNLGSDLHEASYLHGDPLFTARDTLDVSVRVLGSDQFLTFQLSILAQVQVADGGNPRVEVDATVSFPNLPPHMVVVNAYGYGSVVLDAPGDMAPPGRLRARAREDGRVVWIRGVGAGGAGADVALFDLAGRRLAAARLQPSAAGDAELALPSALRSGVYFVRCSDARGARSARFVHVR